MNAKQSLTKVVIVGAGFGGMRAARALANAPVQVTLVDRNNYHLFQPLLYQVATAGLSTSDIAKPVRSMMRRQPNFEFRLAEVLSVDLEARRLKTSAGDIAYDFLILAVGGQTNFFGIQPLEQNAFGLKGLDDAIAIRNHVLRSFELANESGDPRRARALQTIVVVGGGPTGVEISGTLSELIRLVLTKDYPHMDFNATRVMLVEAGDRLLLGFPEKLQHETQTRLREKKVDIRFNTTVTGYDGRVVTFKDGSAIDARTLIWAAGIRSDALVEHLGAAQGSGGRVKVQPSLQLPTRPEVFVIGDAAYLEDGQGRPLPMVAPVAMQQANTAAANIRALISGQPLTEFKYKDPGSLATIGRGAAVARLWGLNFTGFIAWMIWLVVHIFQLIGFRNRLVVLVNWAWNYLRFDQAVRLIVPGYSHARPDKLIQVVETQPDKRVQLFQLAEAGQKARGDTRAG